MISHESRFKEPIQPQARLEIRFCDRGFSKRLLLLPGWATDYRIFSNLDLSYNYLLPVEYNPFDFEKELAEFLKKESIDNISLLGWSMGGLLASDFASRNPERVDELILVSTQKKFNPELLEDIKHKIKENKKTFLYKFYLNFFSEEDREGLSWFKENLLMAYIDELKLDSLLNGLDYLSATQINTASLSGIKKIRIFQGELDKIVPAEEALRLKSELSRADFISFVKTGHAPFLNQQFKDRFING